MYAPYTIEQTRPQCLPHEPVYSHPYRGPTIHNQPRSPSQITIVIFVVTGKTFSVECYLHGGLAIETSDAESTAGKSFNPVIFMGFHHKVLCHSHSHQFLQILPPAASDMKVLQAKAPHNLALLFAAPKVAHISCPPSAASIDNPAEPQRVVCMVIVEAIILP